MSVVRRPLEDDVPNSHRLLLWPFASALTETVPVKAGRAPEAGHETESLNRLKVLSKGMLIWWSDVRLKP